MNEQTVESLRELADRAREEGRHAVVEADLLRGLLDEIPAREKYARALASSLVLRAKLKQVRRQWTRLSRPRRALVGLIAPALAREVDKTLG